MGRYEVSERRATRAARFCLSSIRYQSRRDPLTALRQRMRELAQTRVRFGYRRLLVLLRREGWTLGKKRCYRLYIEEGLGSNNRLDIVVKHQQKGSVGIEVKWLGKRGHTKRLTQGLGQAMLALENRDRTLLMIHCGTVTSDDRRQLQRVADRICLGTKTAIIIVP